MGVIASLALLRVHVLVVELPGQADAAPPRGGGGSRARLDRHAGPGGRRSAARLRHARARRSRRRSTRSGGACRSPRARRTVRRRRRAAATRSTAPPACSRTARCSAARPRTSDVAPSAPSAPAGSVRCVRDWPAGLLLECAAGARRPHRRRRHAAPGRGGGSGGGPRRRRSRSPPPTPRGCCGSRAGRLPRCASTASWTCALAGAPPERLRPRLRSVARLVRRSGDAAVDARPGPAVGRRARAGARAARGGGRRGDRLHPRRACSSARALDGVPLLVAATEPVRG